MNDNPNLSLYIKGLNRDLKDFLLILISYLGNYALKKDSILGGQCINII